jgi:hypothetical protein
MNQGSLQDVLNDIKEKNNRENIFKRQRQAKYRQAKKPLILEESGPESGYRVLF